MIDRNVPAGTIVALMTWDVLDHWRRYSAPFDEFGGSYHDVHPGYYLLWKAFTVAAALSMS
jgi:hypothetical protein